MLLDILVVVRLWFELITSYTLQQLDEEQCQFYLTMSHEFLDQTATILGVGPTLDLAICSETLMILIILCESYEDASPLLCQAWYDPHRFERCQLWTGLAQLLSKGVDNRSVLSESTAEMFNETLMYTVAVLAALTYPSQCLPDELLQAKINVRTVSPSSSFFTLVFVQVANALAGKLLEPNFSAFRDVWLGQFRTPKCTSNILKVTFFSSQRKS